jgi:hypothetical protein
VVIKKYYDYLIYLFKKMRFCDSLKWKKLYFIKEFLKFFGYSPNNNWKLHILGKKKNSKNCFIFTITHLDILRYKIEQN